MLRLSKDIYNAVRAHGEETYPHESCGALLGRASRDGWLIVKSIRATNAAIGSTQHRYEIAPKELVSLVREARALGLEIAGFYHSHPDHPAMWSETDLAEAHWLGCSYLISAVECGRAAATNSFVLGGTCEEDKRFEREAMEIND